MFESIQPPNPGNFVWFLLICSGGGGPTAAPVPFTVADGSGKKIAEGVAKRGCDNGINNR